MKRLKHYSLSKQHFKVGDVVSVLNGYEWFRYPKKMKVIRIKRNSFGRISYVVKPCPVIKETGRKCHFLLLEELVPKGTVS